MEMLPIFFWILSLILLVLPARKLKAMTKPEDLTQVMMLCGLAVLPAMLAMIAILVVPMDIDVFDFYRDSTFFGIIPLLVLATVAVVIFFLANKKVQQLPVGNTKVAELCP